MTFKSICSDDASHYHFNANMNYDVSCSIPSAEELFLKDEDSTGFNRGESNGRNLSISHGINVPVALSIKRQKQPAVICILGFWNCHLMYEIQRILALKRWKNLKDQSGCNRTGIYSNVLGDLNFWLNYQDVFTKSSWYIYFLEH